MDEYNKMDNTILALIPHAPDMILVDPNIKNKICTVVSAVFDLLIDTIQLLNTANINAFDPHVGETQCQIRGYEFALEFQHHASTNHSELLQRLSFATLTLDKIRAMTFTRETLTHFLNRYQLLFSIPAKLLYLAKIRLLSQYKYFNREGNAHIHYQALRNELGLSKNVARRLIHQYQTSIANKSIRFLEKILVNQPKELHFLFDVLQYQDDDKRSVLPCYFVMKIILNHLSASRVPILFIVESTIDPQCQPIVNLLNPNTSRSYNDLKLSQTKQLAYTFYGWSNQLNQHNRQQFAKSLFAHESQSIILANMASHPQYSGAKLQMLANNPYQQCCFKQCESQLIQFSSQFEYYKSLAQHGFCQVKPSLFWIRHIYACDLSHLYTPSQRTDLVLTHYRQAELDTESQNSWQQHSPSLTKTEHLS